MKNAIILHGMPSREEYYDPRMPSLSNAHWFPWLQRQLQLKDIQADTPEVPFSFAPKWETWCREVERFDIGPDTALVGHSCGSGFWVRYLSEHPELRVDKVVLVAPWIDPQGDETGSFFEFDIDPDIASRTAGIVLFHADNDMGNVHSSVAAIREQVKGVEYREFHGYGHFSLADMKTDEFPELLEELMV